MKWRPVKCMNGKNNCWNKVQIYLVEMINQKKFAQAPVEFRRGLIETAPDDISVRILCDLLQINRSTLYYDKKSADIDDIDLLNHIRDVWNRYPFYGYRRITKELKMNGFNVNRKRIQRLMQCGGIQAIYPGPNTSKRNKLHKIHP